MKSVIVFFSVLFLTHNSFAKESSYIKSLKKLSLQELRDHYEVKLKGDNIWIAGTSLSVLDTCVEGDKIRTQDKVEISQMDGDRFVVVGYDFLFKNIKSKKPMVDGDKVIMVDTVFPLTLKIDIVTNDDNFNDKYLFSRSYTIAKCL